VSEGGAAGGSGGRRAVKIKICGLTRPEDVDAVNAARPDYIGFVFARRSRRYVSFEQAAKLRARLDDGVTPVGVFTNADAEDIAGLAARGVIGMVQLHGDESAVYLAGLRGLLAAASAAYVPVIRAIPAEALRSEALRSEALRANVPEAAGGRPDYFLVDHGGGGTGEPFDWRELRGLHRDGLLYPDSALSGGIPFFLAGGIDESNIGAALALGPYAVDVSSGAETNGGKDPERIARLVAAARET
jgi:phosphoribosylanthranilate isomerase